MRTVRVMAALVVVAMMAGCANMQPRLIPVQGGVGAGVNFGDDGGFWANNWGKVLTGAVAAGGLYLAADNNGWLKGGDKSKNDASPAPAPVHPNMGDGNIVVNGPVGGDVEITVGGKAE